jgi:hypothetical protein
MVKAPLYNFAVTESNCERSSRATLHRVTMHCALLSVHKYRPDSDIDNFLRRKVSTFSMQQLDDGQIRSSTGSMCGRPEADAVDIDIGLVPEQCLDNLNAAAEDCNAQRHFPHLVESVDVCASIEEEFD